MCQLSNKIIEQPRDKRQEQAFKNDAILEKCIQENPGLNSVELEKILNKTHGFKRSYLKNALTRLERKGKIISRLSESKEGKIVKRYEYHSEELEKPSKKTKGAIIIPVKLLQNPEQWKQTAFVYGVKNNEIEITPIQSKISENKSFFQKIANVSIENDGLVIVLPVQLAEFLDLNYNNYESKINKNTIKVKIIPKIKKTQSKAKTINNILVLEDNDYWANEFEKKLCEYGYRVFIAKNISEAEEIARLKKIDYYILDDTINFKKEAEDFFTELKKKNSNIYGTFITVDIINQNTYDRLTKLGFSSIIHKHRSDDQKKDLEEILNEQIIRLEMI